MKKVAFVYLKQDSAEYNLSDEVNYNIQRRPQLGFMYLCSVLKGKAETVIFDQAVDDFSLKQLIESLKGYDVVGFYVADVLADKVKNYIQRIKEELKILILVGGPSTFRNPSFLDVGCDIVVYGEGEKTILDILDYSNKNKKLKDIKGIYYKNKGKIVQNKPQELIKDLDSLPFPDRSKIKIGEYHDFFIATMRKPYTTVIASRGCPYQCTYCVSHRIWGNKTRIRSVDNVLAEVDQLVNKYGVKYIAFQDDIFGLSDKWLMEFCEKLIERKHDLRWMCILHPFSLRSDREKGFSLLQKAGCDVVSFGLQSAHPVILRNIKRFPEEALEMQKTIEVTNKLGLLTAVSFIFGLPGETKETMQYTIDYVLKTNPYGVNFYNLSKLKGSEIEETYGDKPVCDLTNDEINAYCAKASKQFYMRPRIVYKLVKHIAFKNPSWFVKVGPEVFGFSRYFGILK